jgi:copper ion binding protein
MKKMMSVAAFSILLIVSLQFAGCGSNKQEEKMSQQSKAVDAANAKTVTVEVSGMTCQGCVNAINTALAETDGVISREVSLEDSSAVIKYDPAKVDEEKLIFAIEDAGYKAKVNQ